MAETGAQLEATVGQVMTGLPIMSAAVLTASQQRPPPTARITSAFLTPERALIASTLATVES